jgi:hypothetical protein
MLCRERDWEHADAILMADAQEALEARIKAICVDLEFRQLDPDANAIQTNYFAGPAEFAPKERDVWRSKDTASIAGNVVVSLHFVKAIHILKGSLFAPACPTEELEFARYSLLLRQLIFENYSW